MGQESAWKVGGGVLVRYFLVCLDLTRHGQEDLLMRISMMRGRGSADCTMGFKVRLALTAADTVRWSFTEGP